MDEQNQSIVQQLFDLSLAQAKEIKKLTAEVGLMGMAMHVLLLNQPKFDAIPDDLREANHHAFNALQQIAAFGGNTTTFDIYAGILRERGIL